MLSVCMPYSRNDALYEMIPQFNLLANVLCCFFGLKLDIVLMV